jgi:23S rRNA U2552 (ribose-2'-O)-methylase RlmE/FtsJ
MPRPPTYPLLPLREHRDREVEATTVELAVAVRAREAAEEAGRRAERERAEAEVRAASVRGDEASRLARGELRASDLVMADAWEQAARAEQADRVRAVERAQTALAAARDAEGEARAKLAQKMADREVVAKDEARFGERAQKARDAAEEEAADELFAVRRREG